MSDSNSYTFTWPAGPEEVILTGTFDDWKGSLPLVKTSSGSFEITTPLPEPKAEDNGKIYFKFIVDGDWTVSDNYDKESDGTGFENNFINVTEIKAKNESTHTTKIPEAGGLPATIVTPSSTKINDGTVHILPIDEPKTQDVNTIGGPGPVIPEDAANIKEFSEIRDVDAKELNERLNKELKDKKEKTKQDSENIINDKESQPEDEENTIEAEIPVIENEEETKQYERAPEPLPETKTKTEHVSTEKKETKTATPVKKTTKPAAKPATKTKEEPKKPKKGIFGKLKKMFG